MKREDMTNVMKEFRNEYQSICLLNKGLPPEVRLSRDALESIDYINDEFHRDEFCKGVQEIEAECRERAAEVQKILSLLQHTFVRPRDNYFVKGLNVGDSVVRSFPHAKLSTDFLELRACMLKENDDRLDEEEDSKQVCVQEDIEVDEMDDGEDTLRKQDDNAQVDRSMPRKVSKMSRLQVS